jgi:hypothetical protein
MLALAWSLEFGIHRAISISPLSIASRENNNNHDPKFRSRTRFFSRSNPIPLTTSARFSIYENVEKIRHTSTSLLLLPTSIGAPPRSIAHAFFLDHNLLARGQIVPSRIRSGSHLPCGNGYRYPRERRHRPGSRAKGHLKALRARHLGRKALCHKRVRKHPFERDLPTRMLTGLFLFSALQ